MLKAEFEASLNAAVVEAKRWLSSLDQRPVRPEADARRCSRRSTRNSPSKVSCPSSWSACWPSEPGPGLMATGSGRFHGWVIGGALPASMAADWLVSAWDQNAGMADTSPAALRDRAGHRPLGPRAARAAGDVLGRLCHRGPDGQHRLPCGGTQLRARRAWMGCGGRRARRCSAGDDRRGRGTAQHDRPRPAVSRARVSRGPRPSKSTTPGASCPARSRPCLPSVSGPTIVCAQAGNVNGGAVDPFGYIRDVIDGRDHGRHLDARRRRLRLVGAGRALAPPPPRRRRAGRLLGDRRPQVAEHPLRLRDGDLCPAGAQRRAMRRPRRRTCLLATTRRCAIRSTSTPSSRGVPVPSPSGRRLRQLGVDGLARVVDRCCRDGGEICATPRRSEGVEVMHQELNQVVVRFSGPGGESTTTHTREVVYEGPGPRHVLSDADGVARSRGDADLGLQLAH